MSLRFTLVVRGMAVEVGSSLSLQWGSVWTVLLLVARAAFGSRRISVIDVQAAALVLAVHWS